MVQRESDVCCCAYTHYFLDETFPWWMCLCCGTALL